MIPKSSGLFGDNHAMQRWVNEPGPVRPDRILP
jgi:hypothetical protein